MTISAARFEEATHVVVRDTKPLCWTSTVEEAEVDADQRRKLHPDDVFSILTVDVVDPDFGYEQDQPPPRPVSPDPEADEQDEESGD